MLLPKLELVFWVLLAAGWEIAAEPFPHLLLARKHPTRVPVVPSNVTAWQCGSSEAVVRELCEEVRVKQRLSMDYWRIQWSQHDCEVRITGGWLLPWPCYYDMWRHYWETRMDIANWCWGQSQVPWCGVTAFAVVLIILKQGHMWKEASALFDMGEQMGINHLTKWPSVYQTAWFVPMRPDVSPSIYVPGGIGRMDEPTAPYSFGHGSLDNGFFDVHTSSALKPIAEALLPNWETITSEWLNGKSEERLWWATEGLGDGTTRR